MKKQFLFAVVMLLWLNFPSGAKEPPKGEVFGGFSVLHVGASEKFAPIAGNGFGWQASAGYHVHPHVAFVADFGGQLTGAAARQPIQPYPGVEHPEGYGPGFSLPRSVGHEFLFGPQLSARLGRIDPFVHALFGGANLRGAGDSAASSKAGFAMGIGGGVDLAESGHPYAFRIQADWLPVRPQGSWFGSAIRFGMGIVYKWGGE